MSELERPWVPNHQLFCPVCLTEPCRDFRENVDGARWQPVMSLMALVSITWAGLDEHALQEPHRRYVCPRPTCRFAEVYPDPDLATFQASGERFDPPRDGFDAPEDWTP